MALQLSFEQQAVARSQITGIMHRYASLARENANWEELGKLLAPGAIYRLADGTELSANQMSNVVRGKEAKYIRHHITTIDIEFVSDSEAHTEALFFAATDTTFTDHWGHWSDIFSRQPDGGWRIKERTIVIEGMAPGGWCDRIYGGDALRTAQREC